MVAAAAVLPLVAGLRGSGDAPSFRDIGEDVRKRIRVQYCSANFSRKKPTCGLPPFGGVAALFSVVSVHPPVRWFVGFWCCF